MRLKQIRNTWKSATAGAVVGVMIVAAFALAVEGAAPDPARVLADDVDEGALTPPAEPLDFVVRTEGRPDGAWEVVASGRAHMPAPAAAITVAAVDGGGADAWSDGRDIALPEGGVFEARFGMPRAESGDEFIVRFVFEAAPEYGLHAAALVIVVDAGARTVVAPVLHAAAVPGDGDADAVEYLVVAEEPDADPDARAIERPTDVGHLDASTTVKGYLKVKAPDGSYYTCRYCKLQIWDYDDGGSGDDLLGTTETTFSGYFAKSVSNSDGSGTADVFLKFTTDSTKGRVLRSDGVLVWIKTGVLQWNCPDTTCDLGTRSFGVSSDSTLRFWTYRAIVTSWYELRYRGPAYDVGKSTVRQPVDGWDGHSSGTAHYHAGGEIHLGSTITSADTVYHEHGHYVMYKGYGNNFPTSNCPSPHYVNGESNTNCAWTEGWANYWALEVPQDPTYTWSSGSWINLESWSCSWGSCGSASGDDVEGRVAATLWDLRDGANDGYDSSISYTLSTIWKVFRYDSGMESTFKAYYNDWGAAGYSQTNFKNAAKQNTINY